MVGVDGTIVTASRIGLLRVIRKCGGHRWAGGFWTRAGAASSHTPKLAGISVTVLYLLPQCVQSRGSDFNPSIGLKRKVLMPEQAGASLLTLAVERAGSAAAVRCRGRLVAGVNDRLYLEVSQLIPTSKRILLDLTDLTHMDSSGLGTLVRLYVSAKSAGCAIQLFNIGKPVRQLLGATHLLSVFEIIGNNNIRCG